MNRLRSPSFDGQDAGLQQGRPPTAHFIRAPHSVGCRNHFASFWQDVSLRVLSTTHLHLFADSRYRLFVNGEFVAYGPARFTMACPQWDSHDLTPLLRIGPNEIRVEVNFYGTSSYQTMPDGAPGWIGWGGSADGRLNLATPGNWICQTHRAWDVDAPLFSFAQNPAEVLDLRRLRAERTAAPTEAPEIIPASAQPWGALQPRRTPYPAYAPHRPKCIRLLAEGDDSLETVGFQNVDLGLPQRALACVGKNGVGAVNQQRAFACWIYSPKPQMIELHGLWAELYLEGKPIAMRDDPARGNHGIYDLPLHQGWNLLAARITLLEEVWSWLMGWDKQTEIQVRALPSLAEPNRFCLSPIAATPPELPEQVTPEQFRLPEGWALDDGDALRVTPARLAAWDVAGASVVDSVGVQPRLQLYQGAVRLLTYDFQNQFYGHLLLDVEAPVGTVLDVSFDDWARPDGRVALYVGNPFTNATDRYILPGGRVRIEGLNPRGGIFIQLTFRLPPGAESDQILVHDIFMRSRRTLSDHLAAFESGDEILDWAVATSHRTLLASTDEAFADCPWRERGTYIGDGWVNLQLLAQMVPDLSIAANFLSMFAESQLPNGQLPACTPSWLRRPHEDFSLIWLLALHDYWARSGDSALARELWPAVQRLWASPSWEADAAGLWTGNDRHLFIDWGCPRAEKQGEANACLNILRVAAARAMAELAEKLGFTAEAQAFAAEADAVSQSILDVLWIPGEGRMAPYRGGKSPALHANVLALRFGVGGGEAILRYLEPFLRDNLRRGLEDSANPADATQGGHIELYFFSYLFPALVEQGRSALALDLLRQHYGFLQSLGAPTLNECFSRAAKRVGSCCHSWSGAPALFAYPVLGGLRQREAGNPYDWELHPPDDCFTGDRLAFTVASRFGPIQVEWRRGPQGFTATWEAPEGIRVHVGVPASASLSQGTA